MTPGPTERRAEISALLRLSLPLAVSAAGNQLMGLVDTAMVGRLGAPALAGVGLAGTIYFAITVAGMGCVLGMDPLVSQAHGAGELERTRRILWQGLRVALLLSVPLVALVAIAPEFLMPGVEAETARAGAAYLRARAPNVVPFLAMTALRSYLQTHGHTRPIMIAMVLANLANVAANYLLIWGDAGLRHLGLPALGVPALGVSGAAHASTLATTVQVVVLALAARRLVAPDAGGPFAGARADWKIAARILRLGVPLGLQYLAEVGAFAIAGVLAGRMGAVPGAAHQVALTLASFTFTVTLGLSHGTAVRVGLAVGRGDTPGARRAGLVGLGLAVAFMSVAAAAFVLVPYPLVRVLTDDASVIQASVRLLVVAAIFQISDGLQVTGAGALRGAGDTRASLWANLAGHYGVGIPLAWTLGVPLRYGITGVWVGLAAGLTFVAVANAVRFWVVSARPMRRA